MDTAEGGGGSRGGGERLEPIVELRHRSAALEVHVLHVLFWSSSHAPSASSSSSGGGGGGGGGIGAAAAAPLRPAPAHLAARPPRTRSRVR